MGGMRIWAISDGVAGNHKQALALAMALAPSVQGAVLALTVHVPRPWRWWSPPLPLSLRRVVGLPVGPLPDWVVGCGRRAAAVLDAMKRLHPALQTVQILDPRVDPARFDLVLVPQHDALRGPNVITTLGALHAVDADWLREGRRAFPEFQRHPAPRQLFLLGAPHRHARWSLADLQVALDVAGACGSVWVSTSRRTPAAMVAWVQNWGRRTGNYVYTGGDPNPYAGLLAWADDITVSPDSVSMLTEACATCVPVYLLPGPAPTGKLARLAASLQGSGRTGPVQTSVTPLRETQAVAEMVRARLRWRHPT